jgi:hypothetical protein
MQNDLWGKYILSNDINCANFGYFAPVGTFFGVLDGNKKRIFDLNIYTNYADNTGLFNILRGVVYDLGLDNFKLKNFLGYNHAGIAGFLDGGKIAFSYAKGVIDFGEAHNTQDSNSSIIGVWIGSGYVKELKPQTKKPVKFSAFDNSVNSAKFSGYGGGGHVGGIAGLVSDGLIFNSYSETKMSLDSYGGGLVGVMNNSSVVYNSYADANILICSNGCASLVSTIELGSTIFNSFGVSNYGNLVWGYGYDLSRIYNSYSSDYIGKNRFLPQSLLGGDYNIPILHNSDSTNNWDFNNIWLNCPTNYPRFKWQGCGKCVGTVYSNAIVVEGDDEGLLGNVESVLIDGADSNSSKKCEYYCNFGFERGMGVDSNRCVSVSEYLCIPPFDENVLVYPGDDLFPIAYWEKFGVLSKADSERKCEYYCDPNLDLVISPDMTRCIPRTVNKAICGDINRVYYLGEDFPGTGNFCEVGNAFYTNGLRLSDFGGAWVEWKCVARDLNSWCRATRKEAELLDVNAILDLNASYENNELFISILCSKRTTAELTLTKVKGDLPITSVSVRCDSVSSRVRLSPSVSLVPQEMYSVHASIRTASLDCSVCSKIDFINIPPAKPNNVFDNSLIALLIVVFLVAFILRSKK